jgi:hypothetical protein
VEGASCPGNRRVKFAIDVSLEYVYVGGAPCPGNGRVKFAINDRFECV